MPRASDFFLNVVDFFAILVPGALLAYLVSDVAGGWTPGALPMLSDPVARWIAFAVAAFLLGQALYALGSWWLDPLYKLTYVHYKKWKKKLGGKELVQERVEGLMGADKNLSGSYPWARAHIAVRDAMAAASIERIDADSKFFRALTLVLIIAAWRLASHAQGSTAAFSLVAGIGSFLRFSHQRWERDETAYELVLALQEKDRKT